jgi:hypothetical protein
MDDLGELLPLYKLPSLPTQAVGRGWGWVYAADAATRLRESRYNNRRRHGSLAVMMGPPNRPNFYKRISLLRETGTYAQTTAIV